MRRAGSVLLGLALPLALFPPLPQFPPRARGGDCKGRRRLLRGASGTVSDGPGNYSVNGNCEWLLEAPSPRHRLLLSVTFLDTECSYDYLFVYDGPSPRSPLLASLSGCSPPPTLEATSGKMLLHLFSDANYNLLGFNASFRASLCPGGCSGRGGCDPRGLCHCSPPWGGPDCSRPLCHPPCHPRGGTCHAASGRCHCRAGFVGQSCDLELGSPEGGGRWYNLSGGDPDFPPRAAAAGAVLDGGLYIFGGLDLNRPLGDLVIFNLSTNSWSRHLLQPGPAPRHSHVAVSWRGSLVLSGGELPGGALADDLWLYDPRQGGWRDLGPPPGAPRPPGLAAHAAAVVGDWLYVFGGRTQGDSFSSGMFRVLLAGEGQGVGGWEQVTPFGGRPPQAAGHSLLFHPPSNSLLLYGGHRPSTARFSSRSNSSELFHLGGRLWAPLRARGGGGAGGEGPPPRAFHSATLVGDYMVVYGGSVHSHYREEKCYEDGIFFYHLGCHRWVPRAQLGRDPHDAGVPGPPPGGGRFSHVAGLLGGGVLLVGGGFSGTPRGDLMAYKVPAAVAQPPAHQAPPDQCSQYQDWDSCSRAPQCTWCGGGCRRPSPHSSCPPSGCPGLPRLLGDCESCLMFGGGADGGLDPGPSPTPPNGPFGWCVQNDSCLSTAEQSRCHVGQISGTFGWWGPRPLFLTQLGQCRTHNFPPGLHLLTFRHPRNDSQPDKVSIIRSTTITLGPGADADVSLVFRGFIYPLLGPPPHPPGPGPSVWARIQRLSVVAKLGRHPNSPDLEEVGRWWAQQERETRPLRRPRPERLFAAPSRGNKYLVQVEGQLNASGGPGGLGAELTLLWDRTGVPGGSEISFFFLEPLRSPPGRCPRYPSCLGCLGDQGCGWCPPSNSCLGRLRPPGGPCGPGGPRLVLTPSHCPLCEEHRDCRSCAGDPFCEWQVLSSRRGDFACSRRGRQEGAVRDPQSCPTPCSQRRTCSQCLSSSNQCAWCQSTSTCFSFAVYLAKYPYGGCRGWYDSVHSTPQCLNCSQLGSCRECLRQLECGWCADPRDPTRGRCLEGDFSGVRDFPNCSAALGAGWSAGGGDAGWSYERCPPLDECRLGLARCHPLARCRDTPQAFLCRCPRGYRGDGVTWCQRTCSEDCGHGHCSGPPEYRCVCQLGWTSPNASLPPAPPDGANASRAAEEGDEDPPPLPRCSLDCGCHFHSSCDLAGPGRCDRCHNGTRGSRCQLCRRGSFGEASGPGGCQPCQCHGHGRPERGHCHPATGRCFCRPPTRGPRCQRCARGHLGDPRSGGLCYRGCGGRSLVANLSSWLALSSSPAPGGDPGPGGGLSYCLWLLSVTGGPQPCPPGGSCPPISVTLWPGAGTSCQGSFAYVFDGVPAFLQGGGLEAVGLEGDPTMLGALCGRGTPEPLTLEARSGVLVLYFEGSSTDPPSGFNATVGVRRCPSPHCSSPPCPGGAEEGQQEEEEEEEEEEIEQDEEEEMDQEEEDEDEEEEEEEDEEEEEEGAEWEGGPPCPSSSPPPHPCPGDCGASEGRGLCDQALGLCVCSGGFGGPDCAQPLGPGTLVWETLDHGQRAAGSAGRFLQRLGHSLLGGPNGTLWMFGGLSLAQGPLGNLYRYSLSQRRWTQLLTGAEGGGPGPSPRWLHAAAPLPLPPPGALLLVGGVTPGGVTGDVWTLDMGTLQWRRHPETLSAVAGHSLTPRGGSWLVLLGGYSPQRGFNRDLLLFHPRPQRWELAPQAGTPPTGLYGHSAVYHPPSDAIYVFGGYRGEPLGPSPDLYVLSCPHLSWSLLDPAPGYKPQPRFFHAAALSGDTLVVLGGRTPGQDFSSDLLLLPLPCGGWIRPHNGSVLGTAPPPSVCQALGGVDGRLFSSGGFNGTPLGGLWGLRLPRDPCQTLPHPADCGGAPAACTWCRGGCVARGEALRLGCDPGPGGVSCPVPSPPQPSDCRELRSCLRCLAPPPHGQDPSPCPWCGGCGGRGGCQRILDPRDCPETGDPHGLGSLPALPPTPSCLEGAPREGEGQQVGEGSPPLPCPPTPCPLRPTCAHCLDTAGGQLCAWSTSLQQCLSRGFVGLRCVAGGCGRLLRPPERCGGGCGGVSQCSQCLQQPGCGWCSRRGRDGVGSCLLGGLRGPRLGPSQCGGDSDWSFLSCPPEDECANGHHQCHPTQLCHDLPRGYRCLCRPGYEPHGGPGPCRPLCPGGCGNGSCVEPGRCHCPFGFVGPDCSVPCECHGHGQCQGPSARHRCLQCLNNTQGPQCERCRPLFVGSPRGGGSCRSCRSFCRQHSAVCLTREQLDRARRDPERYPLDPALIPTWVAEGPSEAGAICVDCANNSVGRRCEGCRAGFFLLNGLCTRCQCNGHAATCNELDGTGCPCHNNTESAPCATPRECHRHQCSKCRDSFHGHPVRGQQCYRLMAVEQEYCLDPTSQSNCFHQPQLRHLPAGRTVLFGVQPKFTNVDIRVTLDVTFGAVDLFLATSYDTFAVDVDPATGRHLVRLQTPDPEAETQGGGGRSGESGAAGAFDPPRTLPTGETQAGGGRSGESGAAGAFYAPRPLPAGETPGGGGRSGESGSGGAFRAPRLRQERAEGLVTYLTVPGGEAAAALVVRGVRDRLVLTYPHTLHPLKSSRFYLLLLGVGEGGGPSQGLLFFRQDQAHIDLFVFFSVFFSCFFLFLALCVLLWKAKQGLDARHEQRRQQQEMTKMASRPFAKVTVCFDGGGAGARDPPRPPPPPPRPPHRRRHLQPHPRPLPAFGAGPVTLEPTEDGVAAVATLLLQLPGGGRGPHRAALASALVTLRQGGLLEFGGGVAGGGPPARKGGGGGLAHELTSMAL